jgi:tryptophan 2,3-dioxygenase
MAVNTHAPVTRTGDSAGAAYLMTTLHRPAFPDLWAIRTEL